jgi:hypothetical protein
MMSNRFYVVYKQVAPGKWRYHIRSTDGMLLRKPIKARQVMELCIRNLERGGWQWQAANEPEEWGKP